MRRNMDYVNNNKQSCNRIGYDDEPRRVEGQSWMFDRKLNMESIFHEKVRLCILFERFNHEKMVGVYSDSFSHRVGNVFSCG